MTCNNGDIYSTLNRSTQLILYKKLSTETTQLFATAFCSLLEDVYVCFHRLVETRSLLKTQPVWKLVRSTKTTLSNLDLFLFEI